MKFTHLNVKSDYSILEGIAKTKDYLNKCLDFKMHSLGIANYGNMFGALKFYLAAKQVGIKPLMGTEVKTELGSFLIYAKTFEGYKDIMKIVSLKKVEQRDILELKNIVLISCFDRNFLNSFSYDKSVESFKILKEIFGEDFYFEICNNKLEDEKIIEKVKNFALLYKIELVATANSHYIEKDDNELKFLISSLKGKNYIKEDLSFRNSLEMYNLFRNYENALYNSNLIAEKCNVEILIENSVFPKLDSKNLEEVVNENILKKYEINDQVIKRVKKELHVIKVKHFQNYFLVVKDIVDYSKSKGIMIGPGRGSAASSIISYILGITDVDPLKYNLLFERFLNLKRVKNPDIDIDVCSNRREELIKYIEDKYKGCKVVTFGKVTKKLLLIELSKFYKINLQEYIDENLIILKTSPINEKVLRYIRKLEGNIWTQSIHASGVVLCDNILNYSPILGTLTQYDMDELDSLGLMKIDLLSLKTLTLLDKTIKKIQENKNDKIILNKIPLEDKATYNLLKKGKTKYIFQLESSSAKKLLESINLESIEDLSIVLALNRPAPLKSNMLEHFLNKKSKAFIYQEQIMEFVASFTGCSLEDSEILIRIISKKEKNLLIEYKKNFKENALKNRKTEKQIDTIFNEIDNFVSYSFNKAHSISYSLISYYCAYFKANHLEEYLASIIDLDFSQIQLLKKYINILNPNINLSNLETKVIYKKIILGLSSIGYISSENLNKIISERANGSYKSIDDFIKRNEISKRHLRVLLFSGAFDCLDGNRFEKLDIIEKTNQLNLFNEKIIFTIAQERREEIDSLGLSLSLYPYAKDRKIGIVRALSNRGALIALENEIIEVKTNLDIKLNNIVEINKKELKILSKSYIKYSYEDIE